MNKWQSRYGSTLKGSWEFRLIPDVTLWLKKKHCELNYYVINIKDNDRLHPRPSTGAVQGSILDPDLWNYDRILRESMPEETFLVGYTDNIAAVILARNTEEVVRPK